MSIDSSDACDRPGIGPAGRRARAFLAGRHFFRQLPSGARAGIGVIWFAFVVFPVINALGVHGSVLEHALTIVGAAGFVAVYVTMVATWHFNRTSPLTLLLFAAMLVLAGALTLAQSSSWGFLFIYCTACSWLVVRKQLGIYVMALCAALAGGLPALAGANGSTVISFIASAAGVGLLMLLMSDLRLRNLQLSEARAELAELAVAQERERFARDLHDLLGHSLSVITLKAELAGRMLTDRPSDAAREVAELEQVARSALGEVRDAVSGYRQPTLEGELAGARMALSAAGIEADVQQAHVSLDPVVEAVLAWTVREGATNVIRHSGARHCTLRVTASLTDAGVEVTDDGGAGAGAVAASGGGRGGRGARRGRPMMVAVARCGRPMMVAVARWGRPTMVAVAQWGRPTIVPVAQWGRPRANSVAWRRRAWARRPTVAAPSVALRRRRSAPEARVAEGTGRRTDATPTQTPEMAQPPGGLSPASTPPVDTPPVDTPPRGVSLADTGSRVWRSALVS